MTISNVLTQLKAKNLDPGKYFDGQGLMLVKSRKDAGKWILRLVVDGRRREMGLGRWPDVSIAEAREAAREARRTLRGGDDPIRTRHSERLSINGLTVADAVRGCFEARQAELKGDGQAGRWMSPLAVHVLPKIGTLAIEDVDQHVLKKVLEPIWHEKPDTARKAIGRMNLVLKHAAALGRSVDLQAVMKAQALLGKRRGTVSHIPALPYREAPSFYKWLCEKPFTSALALRFLVLTVARTSEVRFATFSEIEGDIWTIPAGRTKTNREHRAPLSGEAMVVIKLARHASDQDLIFPTGKGKAMSDATMSRLMQREGYEARPHGFRAAFRSWAEECTDVPFEVKEACLGHVVDKGVVRAYQRGERMEKRRQLLASWEMFLLS